MDSSFFWSEIILIFPSNFSPKLIKTLNIKAYFKSPNIEPNNLFIQPKDINFTTFSSNFDKKTKNKDTTTNKIK